MGRNVYLRVKKFLEAISWGAALLCCAAVSIWMSSTMMTNDIIAAQQRMAAMNIEFHVSLYLGLMIFISIALGLTIFISGTYVVGTILSDSTCFILKHVNKSLRKARRIAVEKLDALDCYLENKKSA